MNNPNNFTRRDILENATMAILAFSGTLSLINSCAMSTSKEQSAIPLEGDYALYEKRIKNAIGKKIVYECVINIGEENKILFQKAYGIHIKGRKKNKGEEIPASLNGIYDIASITKPIATATSILILNDMDKINLKGKINVFLPEFNNTDKSGITVFQLLTHTSGFKYDQTQKETQEEYIRYAKELVLGPKDNKMVYSSVNYRLLKIIIERLTGEALDKFSKKYIFGPIGMKDTMYNPPEEIIERIAPNKDRAGNFAWGKSGGTPKNGVDGSTGLFSTVNDLVRYCRMIINQGEIDGARILQMETCRRMISDKLGWWYFNKNSGAIFHPGATGTMLYINTASKKYLIYLSNGLHSYFEERKKFRSFIEGFAELAEGKELGSIGNSG